MSTRFVSIAITAAVLLSVPAHAKGLKEKKAQREALAILDGHSEIAEMKKNCGVDKVDLQIDFASFSEANVLDKRFGHASVVHYCVNAIDAIGDLCKDPDGKEAVVDQIKSVTCSYDAKATKDQLKRYGPVMSLAKGKLSVGYNKDTANFSDGAKEWLLNNL